MSDDPINPAHYAGTECAQIGERLTGNSYQTLKYNWRLGKKDEATIEVGKSLWYLDREIQLGVDAWRPPTSHPFLTEIGIGLPSDAWFGRRLEGQTDYVISVGWSLINWCRYGDVNTLIFLRESIQQKLNSLRAPGFLSKLGDAPRQG